MNTGCNQFTPVLTRREMLRTCGAGFGSLALASLLDDEARAADPLAVRQPHFPARAKRIIFLFMHGGPSQVDTFDYKPLLERDHGKPLPFSKPRVFSSQTGNLLKSPWRFRQHGDSGAWVSALFPEVAKCVDDLCIINSMHGSNSRHGGALLELHTGSDTFVRPSMGSWLSWGLGSENQNLPAFVVMTSGQFLPSGGSSCWSPGFLPSEHQGVRLMNNGDPVLFLSNPKGTDRARRRRELDALKGLNQEQFTEHGNPETEARVQQYELAFRMQAEVPDLADISTEPKEVLDLYGVEPGKPSFATNCLLARRLSEAGVRFIQLYDWGWDLHGTNTSDDLITQFPRQCMRTDKACAALIQDLEQRGLLEDTIVIWGGEFGRTPMNEERNGSKLLGRDHHPHAFSMWMCGGGFRPGLSYGATDELGYHITENPVSVHDLHATLLHQLGIHHEQFTYRSQGRDFRLTDVEGLVVKELLA